MANFNPENTGTWFFFDESDEAQGGVSVRTVSVDELARIEKLTVKKKDKFKAGTHYVDKTVDEKLSNKLMWDYVLVDWKNVCISGTEVDCSSENKSKLMNDPNFANFIVKSLEHLQDDIDSGKNLAKN